MAASDRLAQKKGPPEAILPLLAEYSEVIMPVANGAPVTVLDAIEGAADDLGPLRLHQLLPIVARDYHGARYPNLHHVSWFLSAADRESFHAGHCDLVPNNFSDVPALIRRTMEAPLMLASASPPDEHGYFSLGTDAEYSAAMIGELPFFLEANARMPRTFGQNQVHVSQVLGWCEADYPLAAVEAPEITERDRTIADFVADRIADGATLQIGIGGAPNAVCSLLTGHRELGAHTELLSDGLVDLVEAGALTGTRKNTHRNQILTTTVLGTQRVYDFVADNPAVQMYPVDYTNAPHRIAREDSMTAINATLEVDLFGQCASESIGSHIYSSTGGQADYAAGATRARNGQSFIVLHSTANVGAVSRIVPQLHPGALVTTTKNQIDNVVTEYGIAELRGRTVAERARRLIDITHPDFREQLTRTAHNLGFLHARA